jgi:hypothetical protein
MSARHRYSPLAAKAADAQLRSASRGMARMNSIIDGNARGRRSRHAVVATIALSLLLALATSASAITNSRVELFNSATFKDAANTTADWNTAAGKLKLFPFQPTLLGSYATTALKVAISGTTAYTVGFSSSLKILNREQPG